MQALTQPELGFHITQQVIALPGRTDIYQIRITTTPRLGEQRLTTADVAERLGLSVRQASRLMASGAITCHCPGLRHRRVYQRDLDAYCRAHGMAQ